MRKESKATLALLARFPTFSDWITQNLTPEQLMAVRDTPIGMTNFGGDHPLNNQELGAQLWQAYKAVTLFELRDAWFEVDYRQAPAAWDRQRHHHQSACMVVALLVVEQRELLDTTIEHHRREIETVTGAGHSPTTRPVADRRNRL